MRDKDSIARISTAITAVQNTLESGYPSKEAKRMIESSVMTNMLSEEEAVIVADIFGFKNTDNSIYFSVNNAREIVNNLRFMRRGTPPKDTETLVRLSEIIGVLSYMEVVHKISPVAATFVQRVFELEYGMQLINYTIYAISPSSERKVYQAISDRLRDLAGAGVCDNSIRLLKQIYGLDKISPRKVDNVAQAIQNKTSHSTTQRAVTSKEIKVGNLSLTEIFALDNAKLSDMYFKSYEIESDYTDNEIMELIEKIEQRQETASRFLKAPRNTSKLIVSADFRADAFLEVSNNNEFIAPNGNRSYKKYVKIYDLYGERVSDELKEYGVKYNRVDVRDIVYRVVIGGKMVYISLDAKYRKLIDKLRTMLINRENVRNEATVEDSPEIKVQYFSSLNMAVTRELSKAELQERLGIFGERYLTNLLDGYKEHLIKVNNIKTKPNELLVLNDFKFDSYIKSPYGPMIKIFKGSGDSAKEEFTPELIAYMKGKSYNNIGHIVYKTRGKSKHRGADQYVEIEEKYAIAIARIKEVLNQESTKSTTSDASSNSIIKLYSLYGIVPDFIEPSYEQFKCWADQYGERFIQKLMEAYQTELDKLPESTFDDFVNANVLLSPFALEGYIQYQYSVVRGRTDNCRGAEWSTQTRYIKLVSNSNTADGVKPKLSEEAIKALTNWKKLKNPRILFKIADGCDEKALVDVREKYRRGIERIEHILKTYNK